MKRLAVKILSVCARAVINKYQPKIVAITGTVGKSSAKEAAYAVLKHSLVTRSSFGNYNTEIGTPLSVLGLSAPGRSIFRWLKVFGRTIRLLLVADHTYPDVLVLEMAADKPGDIAALTAIAKPHIAAITAITPVHMEKFGSMEKVKKEKTGIWHGMTPNGVAVANIDDPLVREDAEKIKGKKITYGFSADAQIRAGEINIFEGGGAEIEERVKGTAFKLYSDGSVLPVHLPGVLGRSHVLSALSGVAIGTAMGLNYHEVIEGLHGYGALPGRMRLIPGIKHTLLVDDTYNSSPAASISALEELKNVPIGEGNKHYAVLGDMLELGEDSERYHTEIGRKAAELGIGVLVGVGERSATIAAAAREAGMEEGNVFHFGRAEDAGRFIQDRIKRGDALLIKGSRGMRMERVTKELMAEPERAGELLVHE